MEDMIQIQALTKALIDRLKATTISYGLGNSGNEYVVIVQMFLYKFLNDKFANTARKEMPELVAGGKDIYESLNALSDDDYDELCDLMADSIILDREDLLPNLAKHQNDDNFAQLVDATLENIANKNRSVFFILNEDDSRIPIIKPISDLVATSAANKNGFCRALIDDISSFSFESVFDAGYDFFSTVFEYLLKDYNSNGGGVYAEYYTPHSVATIIAKLLVPDGADLKSQTCYDPAAGTGTLLIALAHAIGEDRCSVYTQDISEKSSTMLMLNLILNNMTHSLSHVIKGNTMLHPYHKDDNGNLRKFDFVVTNPPFKLDFSNYQLQLENDQYKRFFAGVPKIPGKKKDSMAIYQCFFQHVLASIKDGGKGAIVVPTGFLTSTGISEAIRKYLVDNKYFKGVISMPSNIFATTGTNVSVVFIDKSEVEQPILIDASKLGIETKEGKTKKTYLTSDDVQKIINTFCNKEKIDDFSVLPSYEEIKSKKYSFSAGQYFEAKIKYIPLTHDEFINKMQDFRLELETLYNESNKIQVNLFKSLEGLKYE